MLYIYKLVIILDEKFWKFDGVNLDDFNVSDIKIEYIINSMFLCKIEIG